MTTTYQPELDFGLATHTRIRRNVGAMSSPTSLNVPDREAIVRLVERCARLHAQEVHTSWLRDLEPETWERLHNPGSLLSALANGGYLEGTGRVERNGRGSNAAKWAPVYRLQRPIPKDWPEKG